MRRRLKHHLLRFLRGAVGVLALLGYLTAALGVPLPAPHSSLVNESGNASATEMRPCGCVVADGDSPCCCCCGSAPVENSEAETLVWVIGEQVRQCHGQDSLWLTVGVALPLPPAVVVPDDVPPSGWPRFVLPLSSSLAFAPTPPPPRT